MSETHGFRIETLFRSKSFFDLADNLERFLDAARQKGNDIHFYKQHYDVLLKLYNISKSPYEIFCNEGIVVPYLITNWSLRDYGKDNAICIKALINQTRETFAPPIGSVICEDMIHVLMNHVDHKYNYCSKVLHCRPLRIIIANETYKKGNSLFEAYEYYNRDLSLAQRDLVILTHVQDEKVTPEYAFLHELGHILHLRLTGQYTAWQPPSSFDILQQAIFSKAESAAISAELFAECFAIATLYNTEYSHFDPYDQIKDDHKRLISEYMQLLMDTYAENPLGGRMLHELLDVRGE